MSPSGFFAKLTKRPMSKKNPQGNNRGALALTSLARIRCATSLQWALKGKVFRSKLLSSRMRLNGLTFGYVPSVLDDLGLGGHHPNVGRCPHALLNELGH